MMSKIMGRTLQHAVGYLQRKVPEYSIYAEIKDMLHNLSNETQTKSKEHEILQNCLKTLKQRLSSGGVGIDEKRFCVMTLLFISNYKIKTNELHHFVIQFIEQSKNIADKKLGYIAMSVLIEKDDSCLYLIINTLLKDINCSDTHVIFAALTTLSNIIVVDLIPVFLPSMEKRLKHPHSDIRQQVLSVYHKMFQVGPEFIRKQMPGIIHQTFRDKNPCVMAATLPLIESTLKADGIVLTHITDNLVFILSQVEAGCLPLHMMYKGISGPWIQLRILNILKQIYHTFADQTTAKVVEVVEKIFNRIQVLSGRIHVAIFVECVTLVSVMQPSLKCKLESCSQCITTLILSGKANLIHTGLLCLIKISEVDVKFAAEHRDKIMDCLKSKDESIRKMALKMVTTLTTEANVKAICVHLCGQMAAEDSSFKSYILRIVLTLAKKYPPDDDWMLQQLHDVVKTTKMTDVDGETVLHELISCMKKATGEIQQMEITWCLNELNEVSSVLQLEYICWVITEYREMISEQDLLPAISYLFNVNELFKTEDPVECELVWLLVVNTLHDLLLRTKKVSLFFERINKMQEIMPASYAVLTSYQEILALMDHKEIIEDLTFSVDGNADEFECDFSFLDEFVEAEKLKHPQWVEEEELNIEEVSSTGVSDLKFHAYHKSDITNQQTKSFIPTGTKVKNKMSASFLSSVKTTKPNTKIETKWNMDGYLPTKKESNTSSMASSSSQEIDSKLLNHSEPKDNDALFSDALFSQVTNTKSAESTLSQNEVTPAKVETLDLNAALENLTNISISPITEDFT